MFLVCQSCALQRCKWRFLIKTVLSVAGACATLAFAAPQTASAKQDAFIAGKTVRAAKSAGAQYMAGVFMEQIVSGRTLENADWTQTIKSNGTQSSEVLDGSWSDAGTWLIVGNQFCREPQATHGKTISSDVYYTDRVLRFAEDANPRDRRGWHETS